MPPNNNPPVYAYPCHVNPANFLSVKLSGESNYVPWQKQVQCLLDGHDMAGFIDGTHPIPNLQENEQYQKWKMSDSLVKGWIFGSVSENVMGTVVGQETAKQVWDELKKKYNSIPAANAIDYTQHIPLCEAIEREDWQQALVFFNADRRRLHAQIDKNGNTALNIAINNHENTQFLEKLLNEIDTLALPTLTNALRYAIVCGNEAAVKKLVEKNHDLLFIDDERAELPLLVAASYYHRTIYDYLFKECKTHINLARGDGLSAPQEGENASVLLTCIIRAGYFDAAYDLIKECYDTLADENDPYPLGDTLYLLVKNWDAYLSAKRYNFYQKFVYSNVPIEDCSLENTPPAPDIENQLACLLTWKNYVMRKIYVKFWEVLLHVPHIKNLHEDKLKHDKTHNILKFLCDKASKIGGSEEYKRALVLAVENNNREVIEHITKSFRQSIRNTRDNKYTLYQLSIMNRCEHAYNFLVHEAPYHKDLHHSTVFSDHEDNLLHLVGKLAPQDKLNMVTGATLQMQRELQWFQEVGKLVPIKEREARNNEEKTPTMVFRNEHEDLRQKGEEWMKHTANSYTITAALIITMVFAGAITVPGGNNGDTGEAIYKTKPAFIIFIVSDAIALFTSTTSLLLFLSILTARYAIDDFLYKLPKRLILGLIMLFMSVVTMLIAFSATLYIMAGQENSWILIPISIVTCLPIVSFVTLQLPLLYDLLSSTYGRGIFVKRAHITSYK